MKPIREIGHFHGQVNETNDVIRKMRQFHGQAKTSGQNVIQNNEDETRCPVSSSLFNNVKEIFPNRYFLPLAAIMPERVSLKSFAAASFSTVRCIR